MDLPCSGSYASSDLYVLSVSETQGRVLTEEGNGALGRRQYKPECFRLTIANK